MNRNFATRELTLFHGKGVAAQRRGDVEDVAGQKAIPLVALRARSLSLRPSCGRGKTSTPPSQAKGKDILTPFRRKGVAPQARGDVVGRRASQRGAALIVAMILLIVITLVGLAAIGTTIIQNKASSNQYDRQLAFQSAEAALRVAAATIPNDIARDCQNGGVVCQANPFTDSGLPSGSIHTVTAGTGTTTTFTASTLAPMQPQFVIESLGKFTNTSTDVGFGNTANSRNYGVQGGSLSALYYRITARSCDPADARCDSRAIVTLQAVVKQG